MATIQAQKQWYCWKQDFLWLSMLRGYKDNWSKNTQLEGSCHSDRTWAWKQRNHHRWSHYQATTNEDSAGWRRLSVCSSEWQSVEISNGAIIVITSCVSKWSIDQISNPKPHWESLLHMTNLKKKKISHFHETWYDHHATPVLLPVNNTNMAAKWTPGWTCISII
jgi:hypothetical protein